MPSNQVYIWDGRKIIVQAADGCQPVVRVFCQEKYAQHFSSHTKRAVVGGIGSVAHKNNTRRANYQSPKSVTGVMRRDSSLKKKRKGEVDRTGNIGVSKSYRWYISKTAQ